MRGLSTSGNISLGCALVAGRNRVPRPAAGNTALRTFAIIALILAASNCDNRSMRKIGVVFAFAILCRAADYPDPVEGDFTIRDFHFHDGETLPDLRIHYTTVGDPSLPAVLVMHGTGGTGRAFLSPGFAGELFGPNQPLDAKKYFIIL